MEPEARYTTIGAVLIALIVAAAGVYVWLTSSGRAADFRYYTIYFERQSLDGLQIGADVTMRGLKVGRVEDYTISRDNINRVSVNIRVARETPVSENTTAVVARSFVTGIARVNLETKGTPGPELVTVPQGERFPVIAEGTSEIDVITDAATKLAAQAGDALENLNRVLGPGNQEAITRTIGSIDELTRGLNSRLDHLDTTARSIQSASESFRSAANAFTRSSREIAGSVDRVAGSVEPIGRDAGAALREFVAASRDLERELSGAVKRLEADTGRLARRAEDSLDVGVQELRATTEELRSGVTLISRTLDRLLEPKAVLLGPSPAQMGPGEEAAQ
jgi:phospholipid/cholesterol/gamma-HCH transport system substrate-binding protein